ncbi:hypothetical protein DWY54_21855, partial [Parabacteroides distasonis]
MSKRGAYVYQQIEQSTAEWTADSTIYPPSLWLFERLSNGNLNMKFSDGVHTYAELPLMMQDIKVRIKTNTDTEYVLEITSAEGTITTPNLRDHYDDTDIRNLVTGLRTDVDKLKPVVTSTPSNGQITITPDKAKNDDPDVSITLETKGDKDKSLMADGKYRKLPVYGRNLLLGSGKEVSNSNYNIANYWLAEQIPEGTQVTLTIWGELGGDKTYFQVYASDGITNQRVTLKKEDFVNGRCNVTWNWIAGSSDNTTIRIYAAPGNYTSVSTIYKIKLEYGDISTEWTPAWEDIPDLEERYAYGVEWDTASSSPDGVRVGNMQLHRELPIQSKMRMCEVDRLGAVTAASVSGMVQRLDGSIMTEIPEHWYKLYTNGTKFRMMLSEIPLPGYNHIDKFYISTYEACISRSEGKLWSENLYAYSDGNSSLNNLRGGDNTSDWDGTYRSLLGRPVTNLTRDQFRQAARKRGSGWEMYTYNAHKILFWLFAVEYATLDSQKPFNAQKDANGFA